MKELPPAIRQAADTLLGRRLSDDEMVSIFAFPASQSTARMNLEQWEKEMNELIDSFPQTPLLSDEAISRD